MILKYFIMFQSAIETLEHSNMFLNFLEGFKMILNYFFKIILNYFIVENNI